MSTAAMSAAAIRAAVNGQNTTSPAATSAASIRAAVNGEHTPPAATSDASVRASLSAAEEAQRLEEEGRELQARLDALRERVEEGRKSMEQVAREAGAVPIKHEGDLLFLPRGAISGVFRIDNVSVKVSVDGRRQKEKVEATMGIRVGTAAEEHLEKVKLGEELRALNRRHSSGSFMLDAEGLGLDLNMEDEPSLTSLSRSVSSRSQGAEGPPAESQQLQNHFNSFVFIKPYRPGVPKMNQIIIKLIPKVVQKPPRNSIEPKFGCSDPMWYTFLHGLQYMDSSQAYPMLNPYPELLFPSPPPRASELSDEEGAYEDQDSRRDAMSAHHSSIMEHVSTVSTQNISFMSQMSGSPVGGVVPLKERGELVRLLGEILARKEQLERWEFARKGEVEELREEVMKMRIDVDRMLQVLSKIHREMVTRKAAGPATPFGFSANGANDGSSIGGFSPVGGVQNSQAGQSSPPPSSRK